jgi:hypothetical protein
MRSSGVRFISPAPIQTVNIDSGHLPVITDVISGDTIFRIKKPPLWRLFLLRIDLDRDLPIRNYLRDMNWSGNRPPSGRCCFFRARKMQTNPMTSAPLEELH